LRKLLQGTIMFLGGFILSSVGVMLPWQVRNAYLRVLGAGERVILRSNVFVEFLMDVQFDTQESSAVMRGLRREK